MTVQIVSDLHLEAPKAYDIFEIVPQAPHLALLGDIGTVVPDKDELLAFLVRQLRQFRIVLFVPGNHEAYRGTWTQALQILQKFEEDTRKDPSLGEFILLNQRAFPLPSSRTVVLGCPLFSHIPAESLDRVSFSINDFYETTDWDANAHNAAHQSDLNWLNGEVLKYSDSNIMIFTHWSPTLDARSINSKHAASPITSAFSTDLSQQSCFKSANVKIWAFGHTHYNCDFTLERGDNTSPLRLLTNQRGYYFAQAEGFVLEKIIEIK